MQYKSIKASVMGIDGRTVTGIFAVHGNVDDGDGWTSRDRSHPGLFGDFRVSGRSRAVFLWQHDSSQPPIATIDDVFEVGLADLPAPVRQYAPDATGGVAVRRTYLETPRAEEVLAGLRSGAISEMSYAYEPTRWDLEKAPDGSRELPIRNLYAADLYDISDVNWGMNPATSADGSKGRPLVASAEAVKAALGTYLAELLALDERRRKEGRILSSANYTALKGVADDLDAAVESLRSLLAQAEPKRAGAARQVLLEAQRTLALINGVQL